MVNTTQIIENFTMFSDKFLRTPNNSFTLRDGKLYSYNELIAFFDFEDEKFMVLNKTAGGGMYFSNTASRHITKVVNYLMEKQIEFDLIQTWKTNGG